MAITYRHLRNVKFPIYPLRDRKWYEEDGLLFYGDKILDDKNMPGTTLGIRRLQSPFNDRLMPLGKSITSIVGISKNSYKYYVDSEGIPFEYEKTLFCKLKYFRIKRIEPKGTASLLYLEGLPRPFTIPRPPKQGQVWAGVLHLKGLPWMLYGYSSEWIEEAIRKI